MGRAIRRLRTARAGPAAGHAGRWQRPWPGSRRRPGAGGRRCRRQAAAVSGRWGRAAHGRSRRPRRRRRSSGSSWLSACRCALPGGGPVVAAVLRVRAGERHEGGAVDPQPGRVGLGDDQLVRLDQLGGRGRLRADVIDALEEDDLACTVLGKDVARQPGERGHAEQRRDPIAQQLVAADPGVRHRQGRSVHGGEAPREMVGVAPIRVDRRMVAVRDRVTQRHHRCRGRPGPAGRRLLRRTSSSRSSYRTPNPWPTPPGSRGRGSSSRASCCAASPAPLPRQVDADGEPLQRLHVEADRVAQRLTPGRNQSGDATGEAYGS